MKTILTVMFAIMVGVTFVGSTFADEKKMDAPAGAPGGATGTDMKQGDTSKKSDADKAADKDKKKKDGEKGKH
jgi:hypothetical protein